LYRQPNRINNDNGDRHRDQLHVSADRIRDRDEWGLRFYFFDYRVDD
jgi:hypothetical protein